jgi:hypothetical protein
MAMNRFSRVAGWALAGAALAAAAAIGITAVTAGGGAQASTTTPRCPTAGLEVWLGIGVGGGAAGSTYYPMEFTNTTGYTCHLYGYPGVSGVYNGQQAGSAAARVPSPFAPERTVTLAPRASAHAILQITDVGNFPASSCGAVTATLRVYPPGAFRSTNIPYEFRACSIKGPVYLTVTYVMPHVGIP